MPTIVNLDQIKEALKGIDSIKAIEEGFVAYSQGKVLVPPVGEMQFEDPPGDAHIKYGAIIGDDYYVVKLASGFYKNPTIGLARIQGLMVVFSQKTGQPVSILLDEGHLTNVRTAAAGAVLAKYLAPKNVRRIGIVGAGVQGRMQVEYLEGTVDCKDIIAWDIAQEPLDAYKRDMEAAGYTVETTLDIGKLADTCNFIVTATPSKKPNLMADQIKPGTHITAMGSDTPDKIELDPKILQKADIIVADSLPQSELRGEISQARRAGVLPEDRLFELGNVIQDPALQRQSDDQITIADLTGVGVQDIQIAKAVYLAVKE